MLEYDLTPYNIDNFFSKVKTLDLTRIWHVSIREKKSKRSLAQNKWARKYAAEFGKRIGYDPDEAYDLLMYKCNPVFKTDPQTGNEIRLAGHFSSLNTKEAADVQELIVRFGIAMGFYWEE